MKVARSQVCSSRGKIPGPHLLMTALCNLLQNSFMFNTLVTLKFNHSGIMPVKSETLLICKLNVFLMLSTNNNNNNTFKICT